MIKIPQQVIPKQKEVVQYLRAQGVLKAGVFGSYARRENKKKSDIDILVKVKRGTSLLDLARYELDLEDIVHKRVDLLTYDSIHPYIKENILQDEVPIL